LAIHLYNFLNTMPVEVEIPVDDDGEGSQENEYGFEEFVATCEKITLKMEPRDYRILFRYLKENFFRQAVVTEKEVFPMLKSFLLNKAREKRMEVLRHDARRWANFWELDKQCGLEVGPGSPLPPDSAIAIELDRLQRAAARLPTGVTEKDTRKRDWMFQRYDIGKTGRLVMAAVDNMIHVQFGDVAYDVKDVVRAAFRATKSVRLLNEMGTEGGAESATQIERHEFRLLLLALKAHIELFIAFRMIDSSRDLKINYEEFLKALPLLQSWGIDVSDPQGLFDLLFETIKGRKIDSDNSGEISFNEFVNWALKEAIISDLELRERQSHNVTVGDTVLLLGDNRGQVGKILRYDRNKKKYVVELEDGSTILLSNTEFVTGAATTDVLPQLQGTHYARWFESLLKDIMPGTDHPWITKEPLYIKSEWSTRKGEYLFEIRCEFAGDSLKANAWGKSVKEAQNIAAKFLKHQIENHPAVAEAIGYVNDEVAKEKEAEEQRLKDLNAEKSADEAAFNAYKSELWRRDIIGVSDIDADMFLTILKDCKAGINDRYARMIFRHCQGTTTGSSSTAESRARTGDKVSFGALKEFFQEGFTAKRLTGSLKEIRSKILSNWDIDTWEGFVARSDPSQKEKYLAEFDEKLAAPTSRNAKGNYADGLDYEEFSKSVAQPDSAEEKEIEAAENILKEADGYVATLQAFVTDDQPSSRLPKKATTPKVKTTGGGLVIKSAKRSIADDSYKSTTRKPQARRRAAAGKERT